MNKGIALSADVIVGHLLFAHWAQNASVAIDFIHIHREFRVRRFLGCHVRSRLFHEG